jgi:methyl-accepting chemotaxis protein
MLRIKDLSVANKILLIVGVLGATIVGNAGYAVVSLTEMAKATDELELAAGEIRRGAYLNQGAIELSQQEFRVAADPALVSVVREGNAETRAQFEKRLDELREIAHEEQRSMLDTIQTAYTAYLDNLEATFATADGIGTFELSEAQKRVQLQARQS